MFSPTPSLCHTSWMESTHTHMYMPVHMCTGTHTFMIPDPPRPKTPCLGNTETTFKKTSPRHQGRRPSPTPWGPPTNSTHKPSSCHTASKQRQHSGHPHREGRGANPVLHAAGTTSPPPPRKATQLTMRSWAEFGDCQTGGLLPFPDRARGGGRTAAHHTTPHQQHNTHTKKGGGFG